MGIKENSMSRQGLGPGPSPLKPDARAAEIGEKLGYLSRITDVAVYSQSAHNVTYRLVTVQRDRGRTYRHRCDVGVTSL